MFQKIATPKAKVRSLDKLNAMLESEKKFALQKVNQLANDEANGVELDPGELLEALKAAEWDEAKFRSAVLHLNKRRARAEFVDEHLPGLAEKIEAKSTEFEELQRQIWGMEDEIREMKALMGKCIDYQKGLVSDSPRWLALPISRCTSRIKVLQAQIAREPKQRASAFITEGHHVRMEADSGFRERVENHKVFVCEAEHAIEVLKLRRSELIELAKLSDPQEGMLKGVTSEPEKVYCERLKRAI